MTSALTRLRGIRLAISLVAGLLILVVVSRVGTTLYVEILWHREVEQLPVLVRTLVWVWGLRLVVSAFVFVVLYVNLRVVARSLGTLHIRRRFGNLEIAERLPGRYVTWGAVGVSALLGLWLGAAVQVGDGTGALFLASSAPWGESDPFLGLDLSFYAFTLPVLRAGVTFLLVLLFLVFTVVTAGYAATGSLRLSEGGIVMAERTRRHLGLLVGLFMAGVAVRLVVGMPLALLFGTSDVQNIFGFTDHRARLRMIPVQTAAMALGAAAVVFGAWRNRLVPVVAGIGVPLVLGLGLGQLYPSLVQRFRVVPNELVRESPYIEHALTFTRMGYGLDDLERGRFDALPSGPVDWDAAREQFVGLPMWTASPLLTTFQEVEARYRYYDFRAVDFDRYRDPDGVPGLVALGVREVDPGAIEDPNWQNLHVRERYVAGNGAVVVDASVAGRTPEGRARPLLSGLPPEVRGGGAPPALALDSVLALERASVFVGSRPEPPYAIIQPTDEEYRALDGDRGVPGIDFPRGIPVGGLFRKLLLAWHLRDANLLFSSNVQAESRLVLRRSATDRARAIAPFLRFPESPYPVIHEGRVVWILEGFTSTRFFPLSASYDLEFRRSSSYVRNSVKITVDAVTGEIRFYAMPGADPLRDTYARAYPGLFRPLDEMPAGLREHLRYPRFLLALQSEVLLQYHQADPAIFFGRQDVWAVPQELAQTSQSVPYRAEFGLLRLPGDDERGFHLVTSFVPAGRRNLAAMLAGEIQPDGTPRLRLFDIPVENQVPGPRQVEALVEQDPIISQQFSLWRTGGSRVWTGHLHLIPVGDRVVYVEPVFLAAETDAIPELTRYVLSDGQRVIMTERLDDAIRAFSGEEVVAAPDAGGEAPEAGAEAAFVPTSLPTEALELLDAAETRLREGDWAGFGEVLSRLRALLRDAAGGGPPG